MADRGEYRAIHVALIDDPDFLELSPAARLAVITLKLILGASGIDVVRALVPELMATTGHDEATVHAAVEELRAGDWIRTEGRVVWLRNGLRFEPSKPLASENGRKGIGGHLETLPRVALVNAFADYYDLPRPFPELAAESDDEGATEPPSKPLPTPSEPPTEARKRDKGEGERDIHPTTTPREGTTTLRVIDGGAAAPTPDVDDAASRIIRAANRAMANNPAIDQQRFRPIPTGHGSRQDVLDWIAEGIPIDVILEAVTERAREYRPDGDNRQISTMRYFGAAVREAYRRQQTTDDGGHDERRHDHRRSTATESRGATPRARAAAIGDPSRRTGFIYE